MLEALHATGMACKPTAATMQLAWMLMHADNHIHQSCKELQEGA